MKRRLTEVDEEEASSPGDPGHYMKKLTLDEGRSLIAGDASPTHDGKSQPSLPPTPSPSPIETYYYEINMLLRRAHFERLERNMDTYRS